MDPAIPLRYNDIRIGLARALDAMCKGLNTFVLLISYNVKRAGSVRER